MKNHIPRYDRVGETTNETAIGNFNVRGRVEVYSHEGETIQEVKHVLQFPVSASEGLTSTDEAVQATFEGNNEIARPESYDQNEAPPPAREWQFMDLEEIIEQAQLVPDLAAKIFGIGILLGVLSVIAICFGGDQKLGLLLVIGLIFSAVGLQIAERAKDDVSGSAIK